MMTMNITSKYCQVIGRNISCTANESVTGLKRKT